MKLLSRRTNILEESIQTYVKDNTNSSFVGVIDESMTRQWRASMRHKTKGNTELNGHVGAVAFYTEREMMLNRLGNVKQANANPFMSRNERPLTTLRTYELTTNQNRAIGQERAGFDIIKFIDFNNKIELDMVTWAQQQSPYNVNPQQKLTFYHDLGDAPVFVTAGYKITHPTSGIVYSIDNDAVSCDILYDSFSITINNDEKDVNTNIRYKSAIAASTKLQTLTYDASIQTDDGAVIVTESDFYGGFDPYTQAEGKFALNNDTGAIAKIYSVGTDISMTKTVLVINSKIAFDDGASWSIVEPVAVKRVVDYKVKPDLKNFFYFSDSNEWVVYHNLTNQSYYAGQFFPWVGAVVCYDENDSQTTPSDIIFYPEVISNGIYESAKTVIKWASNQTGKVSFNQGYGIKEAGDQSRMIVNVVAADMALDGKYYTANLKLIHDLRASAVVTTEPFQTVDAIGNGEVCDYAFVCPDINTAETKSRVRIRANSSMFTAIDAAISAHDKTCPDILYEVRIKTSTLSKMFNSITAGEWFHTYQNSILRNADTVPYAINSSWLPTGFVNEYTYSSTIIPGNLVLAIDNLNYFYDADDATYNMVLQCHAKMDQAIDFSSIWAGSSAPTSDMVTVTRHEYWRPMIKVVLANAYVKLTKRISSYGEIVLSDGRLEREYLIEIPCATNVDYTIRGDHTHQYLHPGLFQSDSATPSFSSCQIMMPISYIRAGATVQEDSERIAFENEKLFTTMVFAASDADVPPQTYGRVYGGGVYNSLLPKGAIIEYPKSAVFRQVIPQYIGSETVPASGAFNLSHDVIKLSVLSGSNGGHEQVAFDFEAKVFVLYDNRKWKFGDNEYESFLASPYPSWTFEVDASALLNKFDVLSNPALPDVKRWVSAYCRGFGLTHRTDNGDMINVSESSSEMCLEIWDNKSIAMGCYYQCVVDKALNSNTVYNRTYLERGEDAFLAYTLNGKVVNIAGSNYTVVSVNSPSEMTVTGSAAAKSGLLTVSGVGLYRPNWRSITTSKYDVPTQQFQPNEILPSAYDDPKTLLTAVNNGTYIDEDRNFVFGATTITSDNRKITKYMDLKKPQTDSKSGQSVTDLDRYIDDDNKMRFRVRVKAKIADETSKISKDLDDVVVEYLHYNCVDRKIVGYVETVFVAVADNGVVGISETGSSWLSRNTGVSANLNGVAYGNGVFVAVGDGGMILTSADDGITWTQRTSPTSENLNSVAYWDNRWIIVGDAGTILKAFPTPFTWTLESSGITTNLNKVKPIWLGLYPSPTVNYFAAVGNGGKVLYKQIDATTWSNCATAITDDLYAIAENEISQLIIIGGASGKLMSNGGFYNDNWTNVSSGVVDTVMDIGRYGSVVTSTGYVFRIGHAAVKYANDLRSIYEAAYGSPVKVAVGHDYVLISTVTDAWSAPGSAPIWNRVATFPDHIEDLTISGLDYFQVHSL